MQPYYDDGTIQIFHGDCREILPTLETASVDMVLTDPPYSPATHQGARSLRLGELPLVSFDHIEFDDLHGVLTEVGRIGRRWAVATMDWRHIARLADQPPEGLRFVRFGVWVKPNGAPQFTGDRPGPGWEGIVFLHHEGGRLSWKGGGRSSVFIANKVNSDHPTGKPIPLVRQMVQLFSDEGDVVLDPFMGHGTTLRAAKDLGRKAIGIDIDEANCEYAARRLQQSVLPLMTAD